MQQNSANIKPIKSVGSCPIYTQIIIYFTSIMLAFVSNELFTLM